MRGGILIISRCMCIYICMYAYTNHIISFSLDNHDANTQIIYNQNKPSCESI